MLRVVRFAIYAYNSKIGTCTTTSTADVTRTYGTYDRSRVSVCQRTYAIILGK